MRRVVLKQKQKMRRNLFIDFDGTLVNSSFRQYYLFIELSKNNDISFEKYWDDKREGNNQEEMLKKHCEKKTINKEIFKKLWISKIENPDRLKEDFLYPGVIDFLINSSKEHKLHLVTARQNRKLLIDQLENFNIIQFFDNVLNTAQKISKEDLVRRFIKPNKEDMFIGDTGEDIITGKNLSINSVAVCSGNLKKEILEKYKPDYIFDSIANNKILEI
jgi:phosphoglycolate phosphatase